MPGKKIAIIGAGIAGLSAGCYAQMNGYESEIWESHDIPGGLCTSWKRGDYTFDGCFDYLPGTAPDRMFHPIWRELGAIQHNKFLYQTEYCRYVDADGRQVVFHLDMDKLEAELLALSPQDEKPIRELCGIIRDMHGFHPNVEKAMETMGFAGFVKMMADLVVQRKGYNAFFKYGKVSMKEFAGRFQDPLIRQMLLTIWVPQMPVSMFAAIMAWCPATAGYPQGGSLKIARDIESRYLSLGGKIHYRQKVKSIAVKGGKACGIVPDGGGEVPADIVVSAADGHSTIYGMLQGKYLSKNVRQWYGEARTFPSYIQISLGVRRDMSTLPRLSCVRMSQPVDIGGETAREMIVHNYGFDATLAPAGKTPLVVRFLVAPDDWLSLYPDRPKYRAAKDALAKAVIGELERVYPGITGDVEVVDVATPGTYVRYTGTWRGSTMSWLPTTGNFGKSIAKTLPGLDGFYMAGQWLVPGGGVPNAVKTARDALQMICKKDKKEFRTSVPE